MEISDGNHTEQDENDLFYFESDHLALRGNKDYSETLKSIFVLEAQRQKAIQDYNRIIELRDECLNDPINCVEKLKAGTLNVPEIQSVIDLPKVSWSKYDVKVPSQYLKQLSSDYVPKDVRFDVKDSKSHTKPWTTEEQRKLEDLLVKYPPEEVESRRFRKISNELGNRTPQQVSSRLQKYYLKLIKAGLPVPGRLPKSKSYEKKNPNKKHGKHKYMKPSTFFPDLDIPVVMNELDQVPGPSSSFKAPENKDQSSNYLLPHSYHEDKTNCETSDLDIQINLLKKIKLEKVHEEGERNQPYPHYGFKCDYCEEEPIEGSRWHCLSCTSSSVDYCTDCMLSQMYSDNPHAIRHKFITIRSDKEVVNSSSEDSGSVSGSSVKNEESSSSEFSEDEEAEEVKKEEEELLFSVDSSNSFKFEVSESCPSNIFDCAEYNGDGRTSNGF